MILSQVVKGFQSKVITNSYLFINLSMVDFMKHLFLPLLCLILLWNLLACSNSNSESGRLEEKGIDPQSKIILEESKEKGDWESKENWESKNAQSKTITDTPDLIANSIVIDGVTRTYFVYIPDAFADVEKLPLIIDFHGGNGTAESQYYLSNMQSVADSEGVILVYPQAEVQTGSVWNTLHSSEGNKVSANDFGFIAELITELSLTRDIDDSRVFVSGYSNGAAMAYMIACHLNDRVAGFVVMSGLFPLESEFPCLITSPTAGLIFNGTADAERPYSGMPGYALSVEDAVEFWASSNGGSTSTTSQITENIERSIYIANDGITEVQLFTILGGGHDWFDFPVNGVEMPFFIWSFLSQFSN